MFARRITSAIHRTSLTAMSKSHSYTTMQKAPATPKPSASLILLDHNNKVLLVHRVKSASSFANAHVFPGGNLDSEQDGDSYQLCAIRETFEETGLLLTETPPRQDIDLKAIRQEIHSGKLKFKDWLTKEGLKADTGSLLPFTTWVTPPTMAKRYNTRMFLGFMRDDQKAAGQITIPTDDGGEEIVSTAFLAPEEALERMHAGAIMLFPPQAYLLSRLQAFHGHQEIREWLQCENVGGYIFHPRPEGKMQDGRTILGFGEQGDPHHKAVVKFGKGGMPQDVHIVEAKSLPKL